jgi:DNA helicase HerA-like ATPase
MAHSLIIGMTMSGKSTLARRLVAGYRTNGVHSLILDPLADPAWKNAGAAVLTDDGEYFLEAVFKSKKCAIFVDESGEAIGRYGGEMKKLATRSRHYGHNAHFISQRAVDIDKTIRDQCNDLYCFRVSKKDGETLADEYGYEELLGCSQLQQGEFIKCGRFLKPVKIRLF